jgi:hydroxymethylpyrimidine pyrophosphatase-like HAD family hydrolase
MTLPIKIVTTDFDGTLYTDQEDPPVPLRLQALIGRLQAEGVRWIINTGRDLPSLLAALDQARLAIQPDFLVVVEREIHCRHLLGFVALSPWNQRCAEEHAALFARMTPDLPGLRAWIHQHFRAMVYEDIYSPLCFQAENNSDADRIVAYLHEYCPQVPGLAVVRNDVYARLGHADYNKGTAMAEIARHLGIHRREVFAAGDHYNDLPMLSGDFAGFLVAPDNAVEAVKAAVLRQQGYVSRQPHGHGVAQGLEHYLEGRGLSVDFLKNTLPG